MIFPKAKKIGRELQWHLTGDGVFGLYKKFLFQIGDGPLTSSPGYKYVFAITDDLTEEQKDKIQAALKENKKLLKFSRFEISKRSVYVQFLEHLSFTKLRTVYALMDFMVDQFTQLGVSSEAVCAHCRSKEKLDYYILHDRGVMLCDKCFPQLDEQLNREEREKLTLRNSYAVGFLGSIVYSLPGIVVWIMVAVYIGYLASALAIVIAFLGYKGYHAFRGPAGSAKKYLLVLSNIICIVIANIAAVVFMLMREGIPFSEASVMWLSRLCKGRILKKSVSLVCACACGLVVGLVWCERGDATIAESRACASLRPTKRILFENSKSNYYTSMRYPLKGKSP